MYNSNVTGFDFFLKIYIYNFEEKKGEKRISEICLNKGTNI